MELEQYELALEEQAYPFEEKAIKVHEDNLKLIALGVYNDWVERSLQKLAEIIPVRYDKPEETSGIVGSLDIYVYAIVRPEPPVPKEPETEAPVQAEQSGPAAESETPELEQAEGPDPVTESEPEAPAQTEQSGPAAESETPGLEQAEGPEPVIESETGESDQSDHTGLTNTDQAMRR